MSSLFSQLQTFFWNIFNRPQLNDLLDILIVAVLIYQMIMLTRDTRASEVLKGFLLLVGASLLSSLLGLTALTWVLKQILSNGALVLVVLFQPEIRRVLEQLGRGAKMEHFQSDGEENQRIISEITQCLTSLSRRRVGALIVFERRTGLKDVMETGTRLDSTISAPLLENIFEPNTPLHDGAVIIRGTRIVSAACMLTTLSESNAITRDLGTRHRAAIGISETTDALVLIVSEETGVVSMARDGKLTRHLDAKAIGEILSTMYHQPQDGLYVRAKNWLKGRLNHGRAEN
ncbi:MAG: diadenylate cyclase CdaA [Clostridiales bacterium]|nr:diadenylate cyclase CdaA [Clostridiales bacterium]MDY5469146.1 diadenylate cyclase CdaA [Eubacteriales bacterium]